MPRNPEQDRSTVIAQALSRGMTTGQISGVMGISKRTVTRVSSNLKKYGTPKAPPSGAKQGRPAKVTRGQAEALLGWITARDYTFYVKDLVDFLKNSHGYKGCDGTIRRALIRAGFRRKEPYRKSEITHWVPPSHPVNFVVIADDIQNAQGDDSEMAMDSPEAAHDTEQPGVHVPATPLDSPLTPQHEDVQTHMQPGPQMAADQSQDFRLLDPALRSQQPAPMPPQGQAPMAFSPPQIPQAQSQLGTPAASVSQPSSAANKKRKSVRLDDALKHQVEALQGEVAQKDALIKHLHQQLLQSQTQGISLNHPQPAQSVPPTMMASQQLNTNPPQDA